MKMFVEPEHSLNGRPSAVATCSSTRTLVVMYGYLSDRQCGTMTRQLPGNEQDEFY